MVTVEEVMFVVDSSEFVHVRSQILHLKELSVASWVACSLDADGDLHRNHVMSEGLSSRTQVTETH